MIRAHRKKPPAHRVLSIALPLSLVLGLETGGEANADPGPETFADAVSLFVAGNMLDGLTVQELDDGTTILRVRGTSKATFAVYRLGAPERLVVDVADAKRGKAVPHVPVDSWAVGRVELTSVSEKGANLARIVVDLKRESSYIVVPKGKDLVITITPREVPPESYFARKSAGEHKAEIEAMRREAELASQQARKEVTDAEAKAKSAETKAVEAESKAARSRKEAVAALEEAKAVRKSAESLREKARKSAESQLAGASRKAKRAVEKAGEA